MKVAVICANCNRSFEIFKSRFLRSKRHFCSKVCLDSRKYENTHGYSTTFLDEDNEVSSYFLGLWLADGNISKEGAVSITSKDEDLIKDIAKVTKYTNKISVIVPKNKQHSIKYTIRYFGPITEKIKENGYSPGSKTGKEKIPTKISDTTFKHFLRGVFDGDGSFMLKKGTNHLHSRLVCANRNFLEALLLKIKYVSAVHGGSINKHDNIFDLYFAHQDSIALGAYLYEASTIYLSRKKDIYLKGRTVPLKQTYQKGKICFVKDCNRPTRTLNMCVHHANAHYRKKKKNASMVSSV